MRRTAHIITACAICVLALALFAVPALADAALPDPIDIVEDTVEEYFGIIAVALAAVVVALVAIFRKKK